jgi:hypothetical protein
MPINKTKSDSLIVDEADDDFEFYKDKVLPEDGAIYPKMKYTIYEVRVDLEPYEKSKWDIISRTNTSYIEIDENQGTLRLYLIDLDILYKIKSFESDPVTEGLFYYELIEPSSKVIIKASSNLDKTFFLFKYPSSLVLTLISKGNEKF